MRISWAVAVQRWLETRNEWLLIWDNLEDLDLLQRYQPANRAGALLITTRRQALGTVAQGIELAPMEDEEGMHLLLHRAKVLEPDKQLRNLAVSRPAEYAAASKLVNAFGGLPLALDQAGAYIEETKCSLSDFLALFQHAPLRLLQERSAQTEHSASVVTTFTLAFEKLQQTYYEAAELLMTCCFLAPEEIPEALFTHYATLLSPGLLEVLAEPFAFHAILKSLLAYALVQRHPARQTLAVHRLVQAVLQAQISAEQQQEWQARLINLLVQAFPQDANAVETWPWCEQLLPHVLHCLAQTKANERFWPERSILLIRAAAYLLQRAQFATAEMLYQQALIAQTRVFGKSHSDLVPLFNALADLKRKQGQYTEANALYQRALSIVEQFPEPLQHAVSLNGLATLYPGTESVPLPSPISITHSLILNWFPQLQENHWHDPGSPS